MKLKQSIFVIRKVGMVTTALDLIAGSQCGRAICDRPADLRFDGPGSMGSVFLCERHASFAAEDIIASERRLENALFGPGGPLHHEEPTS